MIKLFGQTDKVYTSNGDVDKKEENNDCKRFP